MRSQTTPAAVTAPAILAELVGAILGGLILAVALYFGIGFALIGSDLGMGVLTLQVYGAILGFGIGAGVGAAIAGRLLGQTGSWWLGALVGMLAGAVMAILPRVTSLRLGLFETLGVAAVVAIVGAVVGYNLRRR